MKHVSNKTHSEKTSFPAATHDQRKRVRLGCRGVNDPVRSTRRWYATMEAHQDFGVVVARIRNENPGHAHGLIAWWRKQATEGETHQVP